MDIKQSTAAYEAWLAQRIPVLAGDLRLKHQRMAQSPFPFFRATFYRWVQLWPQVGREVSAARRVLGVGDLHVENFGTWRDHEGRLIWGINDFDEVALMPFTNDLVRLAASAILAIRERELSCTPEDACDAILSGYRAALAAGGGPFVLAERHRALRQLAISNLRDPVAYWDKLNRLPAERSPVPASVRGALRQALPEQRPPFRLVHRQAGLGSLGRRRFTLLAQWRGGQIAREAKELTTSAWGWEKGARGGSRILYQQALDRAVRVSDPFVSVHANWLLRRLAPDCSRIDLASLPKARDEIKLLGAMGWETANVHLGTQGAGAALHDLDRLPGRWLRKAATVMTAAALEDWKAWTKG